MKDFRILFIGLAAALSAGCGEEKKAAATEKNQPVQQAAPAAGERAGHAVAPAAMQRPATVSTLAVYYHFDDERGAAMTLDAAGGHAGRLNAGVAAGAAGMVRNAAEFSRERNGQITVMEPLNLFTNTATVAAWIKCRGVQQPNATLFFCRGGDTVAGILFGKNGELSYSWGGEQTAAGWRSGLAPPDGAWAFVALVVEPEKATMYLGVPGGPIRSAVNAVPHGIAEFSGAMTMGRDPILASGFDGCLDELGIWKNSMNAAEIEKLFAAGQKFAAHQADAAAVAQAGHRTAVETKIAAKPDWNDAEFAHAVALYNDADSAFVNYLKTRQNPSVLPRIEANLRICADTFERCKKRAPAGLDVQSYEDRCNKLIFDVQATRQISP